MTERSFMPPRRMLMGPGPSDCHTRVLQAMARPTIGHLDPAFIGMMDEVKSLLQYAFRTDNELTFTLSAPGSAGMEAAFVNLIEPGDSVIVCRNGVFGERMRENVVRCGATPIVVDAPWGSPVDVQALADTLERHSGVKAVAFVQAETSTGACSDAEAIARVARDAGCLVIMDSVTALGGVPVEVDAWGIDAVYAGSQKCLSCPPGLAPVSFSPRAAEVVRTRRTPVQSWFLDIGLLTAYWGGGGKRAYHHTAPVNALYALHEALVMLREEGLEAAWARHQYHHQALRHGLEALGLELVVAEAARLPQLNAVHIPDGVDDAWARERLLETHGLEIGAGLGDLAGRAWRIGLMGTSCDAVHVRHCLASLESVLAETGHGPAREGQGSAAAAAYYEAAA